MCSQVMGIFHQSKRQILTSTVLSGFLLITLLYLYGHTPSTRNDGVQDLDESSVVYKINDNQDIINNINISLVADRNKERLERLKFYCSSQPDLQKIAESTRMYTVRSINLSITIIAKVASTTWALFLAQIQARECLKQVDPPRYVQLHTCIREKLKNGQKMPVNVVLVRNPWKRLVSAYSEKAVRSEYKRPQVVSCQERHQLTANQTLTFPQFVECIIATPDDQELDPHWRPQYLMHGPCTSKFTHIAKLETMNEDLVYLLHTANHNLKTADIKKLMVEFTSEQRRPWETKSRDKSFTSMYRELTNDHLSKLQYLYRWDCHLYRYGFNPLDEDSYTDE